MRGRSVRHQSRSVPAWLPPGDHSSPRPTQSCFVHRSAFAAIVGTSRSHLHDVCLREFPTANSQFPKDSQFPTPNPQGLSILGIGSWRLEVVWELGVGNWELALFHSECDRRI